MKTKSAARYGERGVGSYVLPLAGSMKQESPCPFFTQAKKGQGLCLKIAAAE